MGVDVPVTVAQVFQIFKEVYGTRIEAQANKTAFLYKEFDKSKEEMAAGKYWTFPVLDEAGFGAVGARKDGTQLPPATPESPLQTTIYPRYNYATIQVSGPSIAQSRSKALAFIKAKDLEMQEKTLSLISDMNRQCYTNSYGDMWVEASDGANTITFVAGTNMNWFRKGQRIDMFDATLATKRNGTVGTTREGRTITAINKATLTITYDGTDLASSLAATDRVFREDVRCGFTGTQEGAELTGLRHLIDDGTDSSATCQNIARGTYGIWKGQRLFASGTARPLSLRLIQQAIDTTLIESGQDIDFLLSGLGQRLNYVDLLWHDARYADQTFKGGFRVLQYAGGATSIDWYTDKDCLSGQVIGLRRQSVKRYEVQAMGILDEDNAGKIRLPGYDVYEVLLGCYGNIGITRGNCNFRLGDLSEPY